MKKIIFLIFPLLLLFGCKEFLNVNNDPNSLTLDYAKEELVFPAAVENNAAIFGTYVLFLGEIWSQHWTSAAQAPSFQQEDSYQVTAGEYDYDLGTWRGIYSGALMDYELVRKLAMQNQNWTYYLMATVMQCYTYQVLVDFWDQIPMSDALKSHAPKFDNGKQVYDSIIARLDYALSKDLKAATSQKPGDKDLIFGGNMTNWIAFANSIKLKIYIRQIYANPSIISTLSQFLQSNPVFLTTDASFTEFKNESGKDNYTYAREWRSGNTNIRASNTILLYLIKNSDKRYKAFFKPVTEAEYKGMYQGDYRNVYSYPGNQKPELSSPRILSTMPFYFMTKEEVLFLLSEAYLHLDNDQNASYFYKEAINANFARLKNLYSNVILDNVDTLLPMDTAAVYGSGKYAEFKSSLTKEEKLELIITQKWIALTNIGGHETFFEHNRTKFPREYGRIDINYVSGDNNKKGYWLVSCTGVLPEDNAYPRRLIYPSIEQNKNSANVPPIKQLYEKVWWDVKVKSY